MAGREQGDPMEEDANSDATLSVTHQTKCVTVDSQSKSTTSPIFFLGKYGPPVGAEVELV